MFLVLIDVLASLKILLMLNEQIKKLRS